MQEECDVDEEPGFLVRVTGFSSKTTKDALLNFFENTRRSGGGEIKDIQLNQDEGFADIIFWSNQDAETVVQKDNLELDGTNLTTTLKKLPKELPVDVRRLYVVGINDKTTKDGLKSFMEIVSSGEVESMLFGSNSDCMVSLKETIGFHEVQKMCKNNSLDDNFLRIEQVKICDCIEVSGLAPNTTRDAIFYYFRNKRNGGGDVRSCEDIEVSKKRMIISFEDPKVLDSVIKQDHIVDDVRLIVRRYYPFLGETSLTNPAGAEKYNVVIVDPQTILFIKEFLSQEFDQLLQDHRVKYMWQQGSGEIVLGCAEHKMDKKKWENSCEVVVAYINQIVTEKITISQEVWEQMSDEAKDNCAVFENQMSLQHVFDFKTKENSIVLRGKKTDVCNLAKQLQDLVSRIEEQILIEKSKVTKKIELSALQMELMSCTGFVDGLHTRFKDLEVTVISDSNDQAIQLRGLEEEVNECTVIVWQTLSKVKDSETKYSKSVVSILGSERGKAFVATSFKNNSIQAIISFDSSSDTPMMVTAMDRDHMNNAVEFIKNSIEEESIRLDPDQGQLVESEKWKELKLSIQQSMLLQVTEEPATSMLLLVGMKEEVATAKQKVEKFFQDKVIDRVIDVGTGRAKFLFKHELVSIKKIEESLTKHSVKVTKISGESNGTVVVSGTKEGMAQAVAQVDLMVNNIKDRILEVDIDVTTEEDEEKNWLKFLDGVATKRNCVLERCDESENVGELLKEMRPSEEAIKLKIRVFAVDDITIQRVEEDIRAFIERKQVVNTITSESHTNGSNLKVLPYFLFPGDSSVEPGREKIEKVLKVNPYAMEFVNKFVRQEIDQLLQEKRVKCTWQQGSGEIVLGCAEPKMDKRTWENSYDAVAAYFNQIVIVKITVSQEAWKEICEKVKEKCASFTDHVSIVCKEKERTFTLTGKKSDVSVLAERLNDLNSEIQKQIEFEKKRISKSVPLSEAQLELLSFSGFAIDLQARCKDLEVKLSKNDRTIKFTGPGAVVREGNITVWQTMSRVKELDMELPKSIVSIVGSQAGKIFMLTKFKKQHIDAVVNCDPNSDNQLVVTALDRKDAKKAVDVVKDLTSEISIPINEWRLDHLEKLRVIKQSMELELSMLIKITQKQGSLVIAGIKEDVNRAKEKLEDLMRK